MQVLKVAKIAHEYIIARTIPVNKNGILEAFESPSEELKAAKNIKRITYDGTIPTELKI